MNDAQTADLISFGKELKAELAQSKLDTARAKLASSQGKLDIANRELGKSRLEQLRVVVRQSHPGWTQKQIDAYVKGR